jgi:uncharacterized protein (TIGR03663 family)
MATTYNRPEYASEQSDSVSRWLTRAYSVNWYALAYAAILVIAIITRFAGLGDRVMSHDESLHTYYSYQLYNNGDFQHTPLMHGPILFHVTAFFYFLFGANDFTARLYPAILGVLMVLFPLLFRRWLGKTGALLGSILILISPLLLYHHRYIREDTPSIFATILMVYCLFVYVDGPLRLRRKARWLYIFAGALLWSLGSKEVAFMYVAIFGSFLTFYWLLRVYQHFRKVPVKSFFYTIIISALLGGAVALIMYMILSIALGTYPTLQGRVEFLTQQLGTVFSGQAPQEIALFSQWTLLLAAGVIAVVFGTAIWAFRRSPARLRVREIIIILALALVVCSGLIVFEEISKLANRDETLVEDPDNTAIDTTQETSLPIAATWIISGVIIAVVIYSYRAGWWRTLYRFPELDVLILMGTLVLPWLTALPVTLTGASPVDYSQAGYIRSAMILVPLMAVSITVGLVWNWKRWLISAAIFHILFVFFFTTMFTNPQGLATGMVGSLGYWLEQQGVRRGSQPQYYYQLVIMPVYEYLPVIGSFLAMLAGLTLFWNHRRQRLEEETLPAKVGEDGELPAAEMLGVTGSEDESAGSGLRPDPIEAFSPEEKPKRQTRRLAFNRERLARVPFTLFVAWWAVFIFQAFTLAGEKMPWLGTHLTTPMIFLAAWYFGRVIDNVDWAQFRQRGWLLLLLLPLLGVAIFQVLSPFLVGENPLAGLAQPEQALRNQWFAVIFVCLIVGWLIYQIGRRSGWMHVRRMTGVAALLALGLLTFRTAFMAAYINYDYATEYLVYAHGAPGIKLMMSQIEELSRRVSGGMNMRFAWAGNNWPVTWYFRDLTNVNYMGANANAVTLDSAREGIRDAVAVYISEDMEGLIGPLLEDSYYRFDYMRMWWPSWNYYNLNAQRTLNALDFSAENSQAAQIRRGIWDIWWARDYTTYGEATSEDYSPESWNPGEHLLFYVRKDVAAQVWNLGLGDGTALNPMENTTANICTENWQQRYADLALMDSSEQPMTLNHPIDVSVGADGGIYVSEEFSNQVLSFDASGINRGAITTAADGTLNRPHGVAVDASGNLYVTEFDFNFEHVDRISPDGVVLADWGSPGQFGAAAGQVPTDGFWGPRDVAVDGQSNVYISDTGNKRVRVYTADGEYLRDIGGAGSGAGQLDEPAGLAISPDGRLFVADTWNRRVSVFMLDGTPLYTFDVRGWLEDQGNRPYLAVDGLRNLLYVGDPEAGRVLVYDLQGNCLGSFGQPNDTPTDFSQFKTVAGITLDAAGNVYVVDSGVGRVLRFAPFVDTLSGGQTFPLPGAETTLDVTEEIGDVSLIPPESTDEIPTAPDTETTDETIPPEGTVEAVG